MSVTEFKAKCLALLDDIAERGGTITVTKRGRPLATVEQAHRSPWKSPEGSWARKVTFMRDPSDYDMPEWDVLKQTPEAGD